MSLEIELRAVRCDAYGNVEWCLPEHAEHFSLYVGKPGAYAHIADFPDEASALGFAEHWSREWDVPFHNRVQKSG